jgi:hypothetical protein
MFITGGGGGRARRRDDDYEPTPTTKYPIRKNSASAEYGTPPSRAPAGLRTRECAAHPLPNDNPLGRESPLSLSLSRARARRPRHCPLSPHISRRGRRRRPRRATHTPYARGRTSQRTTENWCDGHGMCCAFIKRDTSARMISSRWPCTARSTTQRHAPPPAPASPVSHSVGGGS